jgi:hypothetical protein
MRGRVVRLVPGTGIQVSARRLKKSESESVVGAIVTALARAVKVSRQRSKPAKTRVN